MKTKPVIGQTIFSLNVGNAARYGRTKGLTPYVVASVGRKYFTFEGRHDLRFYIDTWREKTDYSSSHQLYESAQDYIDLCKRQGAIDYIESCFKYGSCTKEVSLSDIIKIKGILKSYE